MGGSNSVLGSILNGVGTDRMAGGNPLKGAMINASMLAGSGGIGNAGANAVNQLPSAISPPNPSIFSTSVDFIKSNPNLSSSAIQMAGNLMSPDKINQSSQQPLNYGNDGQMQYVDFASLLNPQKDVVIRPQNISLLG